MTPISMILGIVLSFMSASSHAPNADQLMQEVVRKAQENRKKLHRVTFENREVEHNFKDKKVTTTTYCVSYDGLGVKMERVRTAAGCNGKVKKPSRFEVDSLKMLATRYQYTLLGETTEAWIIQYKPKAGPLPVDTWGEHGANRTYGMILVDKKELYIRQMSSITPAFTLFKTIKLEYLEVHVAQDKFGDIVVPVRQQYHGRGRGPLGLFSHDGRTIRHHENFALVR